MRIAIDARLIGGTNTGDSTYWTCLVEALADSSPQHELLLISNQSVPAIVPKRSNVQWISLPGRGRLWSLVRLPIAARKLKADVLHVQYSLSPLARNGVTTIHDVSFFVEPSWFSSRDRASMQRSIPIAAKAAKRIVTVSETSAREIEYYVPAAKGKVRVAHNACPSWISRIEDPSVQLERLGVSEPYVLTVGTRWARKNQELALAAVENLPDSLPHKLVVTGKSTQGLKGRRVQPVGYVSEAELCALYSGAAAYLAPSFHEGFGIPLLEAMRCGAPVLCGPGGAMPEVAGDAALVTPDYDIETWTNALSGLLSDESKLNQLQTRGFEREKQFTWKESAERHICIYEESCQN